MSQVSQIDIRCGNCQTWFPSSIFLGDSKTFDVSVMYGNQVQCPACKKMTGCNKENMRVRHGEGDFVDYDTCPSDLEC